MSFGFFIQDDKLDTKGIIRCSKSLETNQGKGYLESSEFSKIKK